jgi:Undecaprenyl-phosphate galactose phosphotransferase WbaP
MVILMLAADLLGFSAAVGVVLVANGLFHLFTFQPSDLKYSAIILVCFLLFFNSKLYPGVGLNPAEEIRLTTQHSTLGFLTGLILFSVLQSPWKINILAFAAVWGFSLVTILLARWGTRILASRSGLWGEPVFLLANGEHASELRCYFCQRRRLGFIPVVATNDTIERKCEICPIPVISLDNLLNSHDNRFADEGIDTILVESSVSHVMMETDAGRRLMHLFKHVIFLSDRGWLDGVSLHVHDLEGLVGIEARRHELNATSSMIKRTVDVVFSIALGVICTPIMVPAAILTKITSRGSILYGQERVGRDGRKIRIYKFRTMVENGEELLREHLATDPESRREWEENQKLRKDPRVTWIGEFLRRYSIDELPQLYNVLKGEMSLVGPRPIMMDQKKLYGDHLEVYCGVRPGLTGFWQVSGRNHTTFDERARYDVYYIRNWSLWLDLYILLRTIWVVLSRDGAY